MIAIIPIYLSLKKFPIFTIKYVILVGGKSTIVHVKNIYIIGENYFWHDLYEVSSNITPRNCTVDNLCMTSPPNITSDISSS